MMQKSKVQEMFPLKWSKARWFEHYIIVVPILLMLFGVCFGFTLISTLILDEYFFSGTVFKAINQNMITWRAFIAISSSLLLGAVLIIGYILTNRFVKDYSFDITDDAIFVTFYYPLPLPFRRRWVSLTIPFDEIQQIDCSRRPYGYGYSGITIITRQYVFSFSRPYTNDFELGSFDEKTAFALKEYILEKMRDAKKSGE